MNNKIEDAIQKLINEKINISIVNFEDEYKMYLDSKEEARIRGNNYKQLS